jgi:hypothetical protein
MFDEKNGSSQFISEVPNKIHHILRLSWIHACCGFVEEQEFGKRSQSSGDFQPSLVTIGKILCQEVALPSEVDELEEAPRFFCRFFFFLFGSRQPAHNAKKPCIQTAMEACENILHGCEVGEEANILIGAGNSKTDDPVRQQANEGMVVKKNLPGFRPVKAGDAIEKGRLASTIGPDDTVDAMFFDLYVQFTYGNQPTEAFGNLF